MASDYPLLTRCSTLCLREAPALLRSPLPLPRSRTSLPPPRNPSGFCFSPTRSLHCNHFPQKPPRASSKALDLVLGRGRDDDDDTDTSDEDEVDDDGDAPFLMSAAERAEMRRAIRTVLDANPEADPEDPEEEADPEERREKVRKLLEKYPLVVEEEDPDWPEDADGRGFNFDQFFNKVTIKNVKKEEDDDDGYDSEKEIVWQDDDYIRPIRDISAVDWEDTVFKDFNPLIILVHNRYKRPKENEKARIELEKAVQMFWQSGLPSPRCVAIDACVECDLVSALKVSVFPEILFTKAGKILHREKVARSAEEWSKIMAFFYYKAARPPCLAKTAGQSQEKIPSLA